jgi:hypothetical protein
LIAPNYHSYRDPVARVVKKQDGWYRYIFKSYQKEFDHLTQSGLYQELVEKGLMICHEELPTDNDDPTIYKLIKPDQILFQSYPFEWSYSQWQKAILAFLEINTITLRYGMILKDATPFNFYLSNGKAVLLDTSSFIFFSKNDPWVAYKQFCEEFLGPVALMHFNGALWSGITKTYLRGLPLAFVSKQLSRASWLNLTCLLHIHWHARFTQKETNKKVQKGFDTEKLLSLLGMIRSSISSWKKPYQFKDHWPAYYQQDFENYLVEKEKVIVNWLLETKPKTVIDLGANTGRFAVIAAKHAKYVIALDKDETCIDLIENEIEHRFLNNITALVGDLAQPTPDLGVLNKEYTSIFARGKSDMALGLALIHHLCIEMNISLNQVAEMFSTFTDGFAVVEFIPTEDERVVQLLANRGDIFTDYNEENFIKSFSIYFNLLNDVELTSSKRKLFLWQKR